jgi:hypothetical protein
MELVYVQLQPAVARGLHAAGVATVAAAVQGIAAQFGTALRPLHPGVEDAALMPFFLAEVPDRATADRLIASLRTHESVEAAYVKPPDEMP